MSPLFIAYWLIFAACTTYQAVFLISRLAGSKSRWEVIKWWKMEAMISVIATCVLWYAFGYSLVMQIGILQRHDLSLWVKALVIGLPQAPVLFNVVVAVSDLYVNRPKRRS